MGHVQEAVEHLGGVDLLEGLPTNVLLQIGLLGQEVAFLSNDEIVSEGDRGGGLFVIFEGEAVVAVSGRERARLGPGDYFGEISLIDAEPRSATVTAVGPLRAFSLASISFRPLLEDHPEVAEKVLLRLCQRLRAAEQALAS